MERKIDAAGNKLPGKVGDKFAGHQVISILPNGTFIVEKPGKYQGKEYYIYSSSGMSKFGNALDMTTNIDSAKTKAEKIDRQTKVEAIMKKETKPLLESYNRLFGKMDSFDRLGIKKGKLNEGRYDENHDPGILIPVRLPEDKQQIQDILKDLRLDWKFLPRENSYYVASDFSERKNLMNKIQDELDEFEIHSEAIMVGD